MKYKINRHEKIAQVMLSGKSVSPDEFVAVFENTDQERVLYRLATNIWNIKKDGGRVKVHKDGRKVLGYQLLNPEEFNSDGRFVGKDVAVIEETPEGDIVVDEVVDVDTHADTEVVSTEVA
jgi:hypothetical protein